MVLHIARFQFYIEGLAEIYRKVYFRVLINPCSNTTIPKDPLTNLTNYTCDPQEEIESLVKISSINMLIL
jgi:hypothetical protein